MSSINVMESGCDPASSGSSQVGLFFISLCRGLYDIISYSFRSSLCQAAHLTHAVSIVQVPSASLASSTGPSERLHCTGKARWPVTRFPFTSTLEPDTGGPGEWQN